MSADQLSLYLDLEENQDADLEVVARTSIALAEAVREIAGFVAPMSDVRLDLVDTSEGSLFLNTKIKLFGTSEKTRKTIITIFLAAAAYAGSSLGDYSLEKFWDWASEHLLGPETTELSEKDKEDIAKQVTAAINAKIGQKPAQKMYRELERDPAIRGVGITNQSKQKPPRVVGRGEFVARGNFSNSTNKIQRKRVRQSEESVVLISPVLVAGKRRWKFRSKEGEFGAPIKDDEFLGSVLSGEMPIVMKSNVEMKVRIETSEEFRNGVWVAIDREIIKVIGVPKQFEGVQELLPFNN